MKEKEKSSIWKYELSDYVTQLLLPLGATVRHFAIQRGKPCIWVQICPSETRSEERTFEAIPTGQPFSRGGTRYIATALTEDGSFVWHLFEVV
jgi:hypothetical protein